MVSFTKAIWSPSKIIIIIMQQQDIETSVRGDQEQTQEAPTPTEEPKKSCIMYAIASCCYNTECAICMEDPTLDKVSIVILPCSHMICGLCLWHSVHHSIDVTGELNCPLCLEEYNA
jgi:hypothetical protein